MPLKITKAAEPIKVERLNVTLYGPPGLGKTTLAFTAASPLLFDFDRGAHRAANRKDIVPVSKWGDATDVSADDLAGYSTVIVDTAGRALDILSADIIARDPKAGRGGALTLQGYGKLKAEFTAWLRMMNGFGKDVILIAHSDEQRNGDDIIERLDVQGGSKGEIYKAADAMGRLTIRNGVRTLSFDPTDAAFGKNPGQLPPMAIPHPDKEPAFLAGVIVQIKDKLNAMSEEQRQAQQATEQWRETLASLKTPDDFNSRLGQVKGESRAVQAIFSKAAEAAGLSFDKKAAAYVEKVAA